MQKIFLYIDESKDISNKKLYILAYSANKKITTLNTHYDQLKADNHFYGEIHGFRRKEVQYLWNELTRIEYWGKQHNIENIYFFEFENFEEKGFKWNAVYNYITDSLGKKGQIYADNITLSKRDLAKLRLFTVLKGYNLELLHSGNNSAIQIADMLCGFCLNNQNTNILGNIDIIRFKYTLYDE